MREAMEQAQRARRFASLAYGFAKRAGAASYADGEARAAWRDARRSECNTWGLGREVWAQQWAQQAQSYARKAAREARAYRAGQGNRRALLEAVYGAARAGGYAMRYAEVRP